MSNKDTKAAQLFREAAEGGDPEGQFQYAQCLREGKGVQQNLQEATEWFRKSADAGHAEAKQALAQLQNRREMPSSSPLVHLQPTHPTSEKESAGLGCAATAGIVALIFFAHSCVNVTGFWGTHEETDWPAALFGTAVVSTIAYFIGKERK